MALEIARAQRDDAAEFLRGTEREALKTFYGFSVVWHDQQEWFRAAEDDRTVGAAAIDIAASIANVRCVIVDLPRRLHGIGRALLSAAEETANYYNCHKMSVMVPDESGAQRFFERCGYHKEAVLPQHTFKLDVAVMRKFLL